MKIGKSSRFLAQLTCRYETISIDVEHFEGLQSDVRFIRLMYLLPTNHIEELLKIDDSVMVGIRLVNHLAKFLIRGKLAERSHNCTKLDRSYASIPVLRSVNYR